MTQNATESQTDIVWKWSSRNQVWFTNLPSPNDQVRKVQMKVKRNETGLWIENGTVSNLYEVSVELDGNPIAARPHSFAFPYTVGGASAYLAKHLPSQVEPDSCRHCIGEAIDKVMRDFGYEVEDATAWLRQGIGDFYLHFGKNETTVCIQNGVADEQELLLNQEVSL